MSAETTGAAQISDAIDSMYDEGEPESAPEQTPSEPVEQPVEPDEEEETFNVTAEELAAIRANPQLAKVHKSLLRGFTQKTQSLAEERKLIESQRQFFDWVERDPAAVAKVLAAHAGLTFKEAESVAKAPSAVDKLTQLVGPEAAKELLPILQEIAGQTLTPVQKTLETLQAKAKADEQRVLEQQSNGAASEFKASLKEQGLEFTPEMEAEMAQTIVRMTEQGFNPGSMTQIQVLELLYPKVAASHSASNASKVAVERIREAAKSVEPVRGIRTTKETSTGISTKKRFGDNFDAAWEEAEKEARRG